MNEQNVEKIDVAELLQELVVILRDEFSAEVTRSAKGIILRFENGETFLVSVGRA